MIKSVIRAVRSSKIYKILFTKNYENVRGKDVEDSHPWQKDLDHLAHKLGQDPVKVETKVAESTIVEEDFQKLFAEAKEEMQQQKQTGSRPVVKKKKRQTDITKVDLDAWWGQAVATWDPIDGKNIDSVNQQPKRQKTKWFDGY